MPKKKYMRNRSQIDREKAEREAKTDKNIEDSDYFKYYKEDEYFLIDIMKAEQPPFDFKLKIIKRLVNQEAVEYFNEEFEEKLVKILEEYKAEDIDIRVI